MTLKIDFILEQGITFMFNFPVLKTLDNDPIDLSGFTGKAQMRPYPTSTISYPFIYTGSNNGIITLGMEAIDTARIKPGNYWYDIKLTNETLVKKAFEGVITVTPLVTKD